MKKVCAASIGMVVACAIMPATAFAHSSCTQVPDNLVANCGFETSDFSVWNAAWPPEADPYTVVSSSNRHTGTYAADLGASPGENSVSQTIEGTEVGGFYEVDFWLSNNNDSLENEFRVEWNGSEIFRLHNALGFPYTQFSFFVIAGFDNTLRFTAQNTTAFFHLDDIVVSHAELSPFQRAPKQAPTKQVPR